MYDKRVELETILSGFVRTGKVGSLRRTTSQSVGGKAPQGRPFLFMI